MRGSISFPLATSARRGEHAADQRPAGRSSSRLLAPALIASICALVAASSASLYGMRQHALDVAVTGEVSLLDAISQNLVRDIYSYDLSLQGVVKGLAEPGLAALSPHLQDSVLFDNAASAEWLGPIVVLDHDGRAIRSSGATAPSSDYHAVLDDLAHRPGLGLYVGAPETSTAAEGAGAIVMAHPLRSEDGALSGAVVGTMRPAYFKQLFSAEKLGGHAEIALARSDGTILAREPEDGGSEPDLDSMRATPAQSGTSTSRSAADGIERIRSYVRLADLPLVLSVSVSVDDVLASWRGRAALIAGVLGALCATAAALGVLLTRQAWRARQAESRLSESDAQYRLLAEHGQDLILCLDAALCAAFVSPASQTLLGYAAQDLLARDARDIVHPDDLASLVSILRVAQTARSTTVATYRLRHGDGHFVWVEGRYSPLPGGGFVAAVRDVTERKVFEQRLEALNAELRHAASSDGLTGLSNRRCFDEALEKELRRAGRTGAPTSLLLLDVDHFKAFNDCYGHPDGDACLRAIAGVVRSWARRPGDVAARYGGEEFALLLPAVDEAGAADLAEGVRAGIEALGLPHEGNAGCGSVVTVSIGCATLRIADGAGGPAALLARADVQLYAAKHRGRNGVAASPPGGAAPISCRAARDAAADGRAVE